MKSKHWIFKVAATLGLLILADYDVGAIIKIVMM